MKKISIDNLFANCGGSACRNRMVVVPGAARNLADDEDTKPCGHSVSQPNCCRNHMVVVPGYGSTQYPFPSTDEVVMKACQRLANIGHQDEDDESDYLSVFDRRHGVIEPLGSPSLLRKKKGGIAATGASAAANDQTLFAAAEGLRVIFHEGRFEASVAEKFDPLTGAVNWARTHMPAKYQPAIESLDGHLTKLQELYREALPKVMDFLAAQHPGASKQELLQAAVAVIDEQLAEILFVLRIWTDAFGQLRDGTYDQLQMVISTVEQAFHLFRTGDINGVCDEDCEKRLKSRVFGIKDVFVARFSGHGPATIPGSRGPVGAHAIEVPHDERDIIPLMLPLYLHEFRHDIFHDVEGLAEETIKKVVERIQAEGKGGKFKFAADTIKLGNQRVKTIDLITKVYADTISEVDADIAGGVLLSGPAFLYNMLMTFSAFNAKEHGVFGQNALLRSGSIYEVDEKGALRFEVHMPDYIRVYIVASALEQLGFKSEADDCRRLADQAAGVPLPKEITWVHGDGKLKMVIRIPFDDLKQVAPVVADVLMNTPMVSLGGVSMAHIVNWTKRRQSKVELLMDNLLAGSNEVPADKGDFFATYVAAATTMAYWKLVGRGTRPVHAALQLSELALSMLETVKERLEAKGCSEAKKDATAAPDEKSGGQAASGKVTTTAPGSGDTTGQPKS